MDRDDRFYVAGTGSRSLVVASVEHQLAIWNLLVADVRRVKEKYGDRLVIISGMAEGFDEFVAKAANECGVSWIGAVPSDGYGEYYWGRNSQTGSDRLQEYNDLLETADEWLDIRDAIFGLEGYDDRRLYFDYAGRTRYHVNFIRNYWMVDNSNAFWVYNPESRGTKHCMRLIEEAGLPFKIIREEG